MLAPNAGFLPVASMGPGSFDPGSSAFPHAAARSVAASMGPGSFDPGSHALTTPHQSACRASMGPGSFDPGSPRRCFLLRHFRGLQWGRGLSTPEVIGDAEGNGIGSGLQWGRGLSTPEVINPRYWSSLAGVLQWGRGLSTPEVLEASHCRRRSRRFNGAGVFRPRKSIHKTKREEEQRLQWGRGLSTPEVNFSRSAIQ